MTICDKCGKRASVEHGLKVSFNKDLEQSGIHQLDYQFDLCDECAMGIVYEMQQAVSKRMKGGSECQTES